MTSKTKKIATKKPAKRNVETPKDAEEEFQTAGLDENLDVEQDDEDDEDDDAEETQAGESNDKPKRKRSGPRNKPGKRQALFECVAGSLMELTEDDSKSKIESIRKRGKKTGEMAVISETVEVTMPPEGVDFDAKKAYAEAVALFTEKYGCAPEIVKGPYLHRRTGATTLLKHKKDRIDVRIADDAAFTSERATAVHIVKGIPWRAMINFTDNPEVVFAFYKGAVNPEEVKQALASDESLKIHKPANGFVYLTCFSDIKKIQASAVSEQNAVSN